MARRRRTSSYVTPNRRAGSVMLAHPTSKPASRRRHRRAFPWRAALAAVVLVGVVAAGVVYVLRQRAADERKREAAAAFAAAWASSDLERMWELTERATRPQLRAFQLAYKKANVAAGVVAVEVGTPGPLEDDRVTLPVTVRTDDFGELAGEVEVPVVDEDGEGRVAWAPHLRLPGVRPGERIRRSEGDAPPRGMVLAADGSRLADDGLGASVAGSPAAGKEPATGLERIYDERLAGNAALRLRFGDRLVKRVEGEPGRDVHSTLDVGLTNAASLALGDRLGGVAVVRPRDGAVLALAGLAVSAPQAPGSTYKIITLAGALETGIADLADSFPVQTSATLSGVQIFNAGGASCGGTLAASFANSCNSVFAPLGAELGAERLVAISERFGFNALPKQIPAIKRSEIATDLRDDLAVGAAAIGQDRDLATPLQMATVGATIANDGVREEPRLAREERRRARRVVSEATAQTVNELMVGVVSGGTGTAAALPGVTVAGKSGTAELVPTQGEPVDPANTNAWFVAFAPAEDPQVAVAVMLIRAGQGGTTAAPVAREVLAAAL
ncbi:MAG: penicillin-binding transpeptidase domain-containing protein [Solirubrobacteraceae bacterium]